MPLAPVRNRVRGKQTRGAYHIQTARNTLMAALVLFVIAIAALLLLLWLNKPKTVSGDVPVVTSQAANLPTPHKPPQDVAIGSSIQALTSPVSPGGNVSMTLRTTESAECSVKVTKLDKQLREVAKITDGGLVNKKADDFGVVTWTWTMPQDAAIGTWQVDVYCTRDSKSTRSIGELKVENQAVTP